MSTATDTFADFVDHLAEALDDHATASGDDLARRFHFSRFHFDRMITSVAGEPPQTFRRRHPAGAGGVPDGDDERAADRRRGGGGLRLARGVHPRLHQGVRRRPGHVAPQARTPADRGAQRGSLPPTRRPAAASTRRGHQHGTPDEDGRAPRVAHRRDGPGRRPAHRRPARPADRARRRRRPADDPLPAQPAGRPDGDVERRDGDPRLRLVGRGARVAELDAAAARDRGVDVPGPRPRRRRREPARRHLRRRALRAGRGLHLRRDDRPRAHLRRPPPHPGRAGPRPRTASTTSAGATRCSGWPSPPEARTGRMATWRSRSCWSCWRSWCWPRRLSPAGSGPGPVAAGGGRRRRRRGSPGSPSSSSPRGGAARAAAAAAVRRRAADLAGRLQRQPPTDPAALGRAGRVHHPRGGRGRPPAAPGRGLADRVRDRGGGRAAGRRRRHRDRPPDRAAPPHRHDPRGRVAAQRRDRAGRRCAPRSRSPPAASASSRSAPTSWSPRSVAPRSASWPS